MTLAEVEFVDWAALAVGIFALVIALKANHAAEGATSAAKAANEISLRSEISSCQARIADSGREIAGIVAGNRRNELNSDQLATLEMAERCLRTHVEAYLNAFESAALRYESDQLDKEVFKKEYRSEIKNICDSKLEHFAHSMHPEEKSKHRAIWRVHNSWFT